MQALLECMAPGGNLDPIKQKETLESFGTFKNTLISLYMAVTGGDDWSKYYDMMSCTGPIYGYAFLVYTFIVPLALFNILTGLLVDQAMSTRRPDRADRILAQRRMYQEGRGQFLEVFHAMDEDGSGRISREEFMHCMNNPAVVAYMASIDVAVHDVALFFDTVAGNMVEEEDRVEVPIEKFVEGCMHMKGSATAIDMQRQLYETHLIHEDLRRFQAAFARDVQNIKSMIGQSYYSSEPATVMKVNETPALLMEL